MTKVADSKIIVGLDIGTSKVSAVIGDVWPDGVINVLGAGVSPSKGIARGGVFDLDAAVRAIQSAIEQAESISDGQIIGVTISLAGENIISLNESGAVPLANVVTSENIEAAMHYAQSVKLPDDLGLLHILPQEYQVDKLPPTKNPLGLSGNRLVANAHLIAAHQDWQRNLVNAVERAKLTVDQVVFSGLASSYSVLTEDEKELGVCLIDIGGGTMDVIVYGDDAVRFSKSYPYGGNDITSYLVRIFDAPTFNEAERIKINYGSAVFPAKNNPDKKLEVISTAGGAPRIFTKNQVAKITSECYTDLFKVVEDELVKKGLKQGLIKGFVLTGGGSQIEDIVECAKNVFDAHVRVGQPLNITGLTDYVNKPQYATVLGLLQFSYYNAKEEKSGISGNPKVDSFIDTFHKGFRKVIDLTKSYF